MISIVILDFTDQTRFIDVFDSRHTAFAFVLRAKMDPLTREGFNRGVIRTLNEPRTIRSCQIKDFAFFEQ